MMRSALTGFVLLFAAGVIAATLACGDATTKTRSEMPSRSVPPALAEALKGRQSGDLIPTNDASFQLQLSQVPARFIVRMNGPRDDVAPKVSAYFRKLGVDDLTSVNLMWCESVKRGMQDVWSCSP
jgi:hypothetical protein